MAKKDKIRTKIIEAAAGIFEHYGYKKTTMDDIAHAVGKGKSSIYYYFPSKEKVFGAVAQREAAQLRQMLEEAIQESQNPREQIKYYVLTRLQKFKTFKNLFNSIEDPELTELDFIPNFREEFENYEINMFQTILEDGCEHGFFRIFDIRLAAIAIIRAMKGMEKPLMTNTDSQAVENTIENTINIILYGIVKR